MENGKDYKYYLELGIEETNKQNFDLAKQALEQALELQPESAFAYFCLAVVFHNKLDLEAAYENYTQAIKYDNKMIDAYYNRAQVILLNDNATEDELCGALKDLEKAYELDDKFIDAYYAAAVIEKKLGEYHKAIALLDRVLLLEPNAVYSKALKKLIQQKYL